VLQPVLDISPEQLVGLQLAVLGAVPVAFALGVLRGGFARTGEIEELGAWPGTAGGGRPALVDALAHTLGDDSLQLVFWAPDRQMHLDEHGVPAELPAVGASASGAPGPGRAATRRGLQRFGDDPGGGDLAAGRDRRRRCRAAPTRARGDARTSDRTRAVGRGGGSMRSHAGPTRLDLHLDDGALPGAVESTAYLVVAEGLANALKHSRARTFNVRLAHVGGSFVVEVSDDGVGGASVGRGAGLRGLADRVDVLGGRLRVDSPQGQGTHLVAELPCGS
jgi:hypothetical protein